MFYANESGLCGEFVFADRDACSFAGNRGIVLIMHQSHSIHPSDQRPQRIHVGQPAAALAAQMKLFLRSCRLRRRGNHRTRLRRLHAIYLWTESIRVVDRKRFNVDLLRSRTGAIIVTTCFLRGENRCLFERLYFFAQYESVIETCCLVSKWERDCRSIKWVIEHIICATVFVFREHI